MHDVQHAPAESGPPSRPSVIASDLLRVPRLSRLPASRPPWPVAVVVIWIVVLQIGGPAAAKMGLRGPLYPNEAVFALAILGMLGVAAFRRERFTAASGLDAPRLAFLAVAIFAIAFGIAATRGFSAYGVGAVDDAGLGYVLLIPLVTLAFAGRPEWQEWLLRALFWASIGSIPAYAFEYASGNTFAPLPLSIGFVLLFSVGPMVDDWCHHQLPLLGQLFVLAILGLIAWTGSRTALGSLLLGLLVIIGFSVRGSRARMAVAGTVLAAAGLLLVALLAAPSLVERIPPVRAAADTFNLTLSTKGNNARWRLDFSGALLHRSVESTESAALGVGLGRPSDFVWHETCCNVFAYDYRNLPVPPGVQANGAVSGPHDGFVDIAYRLGWPAALAFLAMLLIGIESARRYLRRTSGDEARSVRLLLAATTAGIFVVLTSDALRVPEAAVPFVAVVGVLGARTLYRQRAPSSAGARSSGTHTVGEG